MKHTYHQHKTPLGKLLLFTFLFLIFNTHSTKGYSQYVWKWGRSVNCLDSGSHYFSDDWAVATDKFGHVYAAGITFQPSLSIDTFVYRDSMANAISFLVKYDTSGNVIWVKYYSTSVDGIEDLATDSLGNIYLAGSFLTPRVIFGSDTLYNPPGMYHSDHVISNFVVKLDSFGNSIWARQLDSTDNMVSLALDKFGNIYFTGQYHGSYNHFGAFPLINHDTSGFSTDIYVAKLNNSGSILWVKTMGGNTTIFGNGFDYANGIAVDAESNVFITGNYNSPVFNIGTTTFYDTSVQNRIFIAKYDSSGHFLWAKSPYQATTGITLMWDNYSNGICVDANGNAYITGFFSSNFILFGSDTLFNHNEGLSDVFFTKYNPLGNVVWAKLFGGKYDENGYEIFIDSFSQNIWLTGAMVSDTVYFGSDTLFGTSAGDDWYLVKCDTNGNVRYLKYNPIGGEDKTGVAGDNSGNIYICGDYELTPFIINHDTLCPIYDYTTEIYYFAKFGPPDPPSEALLIDKANSTIQVSIYPNPSRNEFNITTVDNQFANTSAYLYNAKWELLQSQQLSDNKLVFSVVGYPSVVYFCKIINGKEAIVKKVIVE